MILSVQLQLESEKHNKAKVEFVMVTNNLHSYRLLSEIAALVSDLGSKVDFEPVYYLKQIDEKQFKMVNETHLSNDYVEPGQLEEHCFYGRYCMHHDRGSRYKLREFFEETARQLCLFQNSDRPQQWWAYVHKYQFMCLERPQFATLEECYTGVMKAAGLDSLKQTVKDCVHDSKVYFSGSGREAKVKDNKSNICT